MSGQKSTGSLGHSKHRAANFHSKRGVNSAKVIAENERDRLRDERTKKRWRNIKRKLQCWTDDISELFQVGDK